MKKGIDLNKPLKNIILVGLGNPGGEYEDTRHNTGRIFVEKISKKFIFSEWKEDKKKKALVSLGKIEKTKVLAILPNTFMNKSGESLKSLIKNEKGAESLIVIHDELDLPLGRVKMSFGKSAGGHRGVESIVKSLKTDKFTRIRVGISGSVSGKLQKPIGEKPVIDFILGHFSDKETRSLKRLEKDIFEAIEIVCREGIAKAMGFLNSKS